MRWLRDILNPIKTRDRIQTRMFVFDDYSAAADYSEFLTQVEQSNNLEIIETIENWDQTGVLTKVVTYRSRGGNE